MATFERGVIKFFDSRKEKRFGFILLPSGDEIFFHFNEGRAVKVGLETPSLMAAPAREPAKGDILLFERSKNRKGDKAAPWCFASDWKRAEQEIARRTVYRLMKQTGEFRITRDPQVAWQGTDTADLRAKFSAIRLKIEYKGGISGWVKYWFEKKTPGGWERMDDCDPRDIYLDLGRVKKPDMPLKVAKGILATARRDNLVDDEFGDSEAFWSAGTRQVAQAYIRHYGATVTMKETEEYDVTRFRDAEADELVKLGLPGKVDHNDSGDPREIDGIYHGADY